MKEIKVKSKGIQGRDVKDKPEKMEQLNLLFKTNDHLSPEFILDALMAKLESDLEDGKVSDQINAEFAMSQMDSLYVSWLEW